MKKIILTKHLQLRMELRNISKNEITKILQNPSSIFYDNLNETYIAIGKPEYLKKHYMIAYRKDTDTIHAITCHPISTAQIQNRIKSKIDNIRILWIRTLDLSRI